MSRLVASFTDAWIETEINDINEHVNLSHLLQMRGLKRHFGLKFDNQNLSHLLQMRGLKRLVKIMKPLGIYVASFTDAWIETQSLLIHHLRCNRSHLLQMRGLKHPAVGLVFYQLGRIFYRCVD